MTPVPIPLYGAASLSAPSSPQRIGFVRLASPVLWRSDHTTHTNLTSSRPGESLLSPRRIFVSAPPRRIRDLQRGALDRIGRVQHIPRAPVPLALDGGRAGHCPRPPEPRPAAPARAAPTGRHPPGPSRPPPCSPLVPASPPASATSAPDSRANNSRRPPPSPFLARTPGLLEPCRPSACSLQSPCPSLPTAFPPLTGAELRHTARGPRGPAGLLR